MSETTKRISEITGFPETTVSGIFIALKTLVTRELRNGNEVELPELGKFLPRDLDERDGRNPRTGEPLTIPGKRYPKFKFSRAIAGEIQPIAAAKKQPQEQKAQPSVPPPPPPPPAVDNTVPPPPPPPPQAEKTWYVATRDGTITLGQSELLKMAKPETQIYEPSIGWRQIRDIPELMSLITPFAY
ncbi:MAG: HU family DNA-binding protein [Thiotrichales bacterium]|nr:HU family DNA-binding protein [Thiotrichales bacterium]